MAHFEPSKGLYIYNHDNQIYFLDGINKPHLVANGTDGVLFLDKARNQPFDYLEDTPPGWVDRLLVESISFDENSSNLDVVEQQQVFKVWRLIFDMVNHY